MEITRQYIDRLTYRIIGCAIEVHRKLGPGLLESVYHQCFKKELNLQGIPYKSELCFPLEYKGIEILAEFRLDMLVEDLIVVELKAIEVILPVHKAQIFSYMKLLNKPKGILINFHCANIFREGQFTFVNHFYSALV